MAKRKTIQSICKSYRKRLRKAKTPKGRRSAMTALNKCLRKQGYSTKLGSKRVKRRYGSKKSKKKSKKKSRTYKSLDVCKSKLRSYLIREKYKRGRKKSRSKIISDIIKKFPRCKKSLKR